MSSGAIRRLLPQTEIRNPVQRIPASRSARLPSAAMENRSLIPEPLGIPGRHASYSSALSKCCFRAALSASITLGICSTSVDSVSPQSVATARLNPPLISPGLVENADEAVSFVSDEGRQMRGGFRLHAANPLLQLLTHRDCLVTTTWRTLLGANKSRPP